jgi:hypothetical protein
VFYRQKPGFLKKPGFSDQGRNVSQSADQVLVVGGLKIHPELLEEVPAERCVLHECMGACCSGGVWLDKAQVATFVPYVDTIKANLPEERRDPDTWLSAPEPGEDVPPGAEIGTNVIDDPVQPGQTCCVFLRPDRKCAFQLTSQQLGLGWPGLKPFFCALYPLYVEDGEFVIDHDTEAVFPKANCRRFSSEKKPVYQIFKDEVVLVLGEEGYRELETKAKKLTRAA